MTARAKCSGTGNMTRERTLSPAATETFYALYVAAFEPMQTRAAARHLLSAEEFAAEMVDERIDKYVVWGDDGEPVAMTTLTTDLSAIAWISAEYYARRYPEQAARRAIFYLGYTLVHPDHANRGIFTVMLDRLVQLFTEARGVCAFDVCAYNDARTIGRFVAALPEEGRTTVEALDVQTYYGIAFGGSAPAGAAAGAAA